MKIGMIGIGNIGKYHIREFLNKDCLIVATISSKFKEIEEKYNISLNNYKNTENLIKNENIDLMIICSPTDTHYMYTKMCLQNDISVFCEKPFVYNYKEDNVSRCKELLLMAQTKNLFLNTNTQWVYGIEQIKYLIPKKLNKIVLYMEHYKQKEDINFFTENFSHMNSIIIYLLGNKKISNLNYNVDNYPCIFNFYYGNIEIEYRLNYPHNKKIIFQFNDTIFNRKVDKDYNQYFQINNEKIRIEDPLKLSIKNFVEKKSLIEDKDILKNVEITENILKK